MKWAIIVIAVLVVSLSTPAFTPSGSVDEKPILNWGEAIRWIKMGVVVDVGGPGDPDEVSAGSGFVLFDDGIYKMWYAAYSQTTTIWCIMYATSPDGLTFSKQGVVLEVGAPGEMDDDFVRDSMVLRNAGGTYEMWYTGQKKGVFGWRIFHATSTDGIIWQKDGVVFSGGGAVGHPNVILKPGGFYRMWYSEYDGLHWRIYTATSPDGLDWTVDGLVLDVGAPGGPDSLHVYMPSVLVEPDGTHVMFYSTSDGNPFNIVDTYYAISPNGAAGSWTKEGLAITHGGSGDYDEIQAIRPCITKRPSGLYELWYTGYDGINRRVMLALGAGDIPIRLTTSVINGTDIILNWTIPDSTFVDFYLIYRAYDQRSFDFSSWLHNTSSDPDPLITSWTDVGAAIVNSPTEMYYVVRAVYSYGLFGTTSNTAGKWTMRFNRGITSFSLPLKPFESRNVSWFADKTPYLEHLSWLDSGNNWVVHKKPMSEGTNDSQVLFGHAYEMSLYLDSHFTFCGMPGSMIRYKGGLGDDPMWARSLRATDDGISIDVSWNPIPNASEYIIMESARRDGLNELTQGQFARVPGSQTSWGFWDPFWGGSRYIMVIAVDSNGIWGSSTYSVGIERISLESGTSTFGPRLDYQNDIDVYTFCLEHPVVGVAHVMSNVWKFHSSIMPRDAYNAQIEQGSGYQVSSDGPGDIRIIEIGY